MDEITKTTLGAALFEFNCFTSQEDPTKPKQRATKQTTAMNTSATTAGSTTTAQSAGPVSGYKSSGPHSGEIPNLIGTAGVKENPTVSLMYCVQADKIGKNTPNAFITPLNTTTTGNIIKVDKTTAETVKFGSGNGYTDCTCWFTDINQADGLDTTYFDIFEMDTIRKIVKENDVITIVNCAAWTKLLFLSLLNNLI